MHFAIVMILSIVAAIFLACGAILCLMLWEPGGGR